MTLELKDLLLEKPVTLILWELDSKPDPIFQALQGETEIRSISSIEEFLEWIKMVDVRYFIVGVKTLDKLKEAKTILDGIVIEKRRNIFIVFISPNLNTMDMKEMFLFSVNLILNEKDIKDFEKILSKAKAYWEHLYKPYFTTLNKLLEGSI
jgi:hypothetical protein